jgi:hypothetical protein
MVSPWPGPSHGPRALRDGAERPPSTGRRARGGGIPNVGYWNPLMAVRGGGYPDLTTGARTKSFDLPSTPRAARSADDDEVVAVDDLPRVADTELLGGLGG